MYAHIRGVVDELAADRVVIDALGVGYEIFCSNATLRRLKQGSEAKLLVHFHLAQDVMSLYGFITSEERTMFRRLISVSRVGPKLALSVLSTLSVSDIALAIMTDNAAAFDVVSGMGRKTAARVLLELKEKLDGDVAAGAGIFQGSEVEPHTDMRAEAAAALMALGYDGLTATRAVSKVNGSDRVQDMITMALAEIAKRGNK